jgi:hypothetical protein
VAYSSRDWLHQLINKHNSAALLPQTVYARTPGHPSLCWSRSPLLCLQCIYRAHRRRHGLFTTQKSCP